MKLLLAEMIHIIKDTNSINNKKNIEELLCWYTYHNTIKKKENKWPETHIKIKEARE